jgi:hypothetical protein
MNGGAGEWRTDPSGKHEFRYWDGEKWTEHVSDQGQQALEAYDGTVAVRSTSTQTMQQPVTPTVIVQHKSRGCLWVFLVVVALVILGVVVFALAINKAIDNLNTEQAKHAITQQQFHNVQLGVTQATLEQQLGKPPENTQEFVTKGILAQADINSSCVYYNKVGETFGSRYQFCFDNDALTTKSAY